MTENAESKGNPDANKVPLKSGDLMTLITTFNKISDWYCEDPEDSKTCTADIGPVITEGSNIVNRILDQFSEAYKACSVAYLGYSEYSNVTKHFNITVPNSDETPKDGDTRITLTIDQALNSQFYVSTNNGGNKNFFNMNRFRNRPIFCGVNVLYDPTVTEAFKATRHMVDYFKKPWDKSYESPKYNGTDPENGIACRDLSFCPDYLKDLQLEAGDKDSNEPPLVFALVKNGCALGVSMIRPSTLGTISKEPSQFSRVFAFSDNPTQDYNIILPKAKVKRTIPEIVKGNVVMKEGKKLAYNNAVWQVVPPTTNNDPFNPRPVDDGGIITATLTHPCIAFAGEIVDGYEMVSYIAVPLCSWSYFNSESSGYAGTKAIGRLESTGACGPFIRVRAKGYYNTTMSKIMSANTTIVLEKFTYKDGDNADKEDLRSIDLKVEDANGNVTFDPYMGPIGPALKTAAFKMLGYAASYKDREDDFINESVDGTLVKIGVMTNHEEDYLANYALHIYNNAYLRDDPANPQFIKDMFNEVHLPLRFSFFIIRGDLSKIYINQYPCTPIINARPMDDDYITQLMPLYQEVPVESEEEEEAAKASETKTWYLNPNDILISGISSTFYNVNTQKTSIVEYPSNGNDRTGQMYTCTGFVYCGQEKDADGNIIPSIPKTIKVISLTDPGATASNITQPIMIAPNNQLTYMTTAGQSDFASASRRAYIEYIKNGCVFSDAEPGTIAPEPAKDGASHVSGDRNGVFALYGSITIDPTANTEADDPKDYDKEKSGINWKIVGPVIGVFVVIILIVLGLVIFYRRRHNNDWCLGESVDRKINRLVSA